MEENKEDITEDAISKVLTALSSDIEEKNKELYLKLAEGVSTKIVSPEDFFYAHLYPHDQFIDGLIQMTISNNRDVKVILRHGHLIEYHFQKLFERFEGSACCADKSRTIMNRLYNFYLNDEKIKFNYDSEYTYHLPKKIFREHDQIISFYNSVRALLYGSPDKYLEELVVLANLSKGEPNDG